MRFNYSFVENGMFPAKILNLCVMIAECKERSVHLRKKFPHKFKDLENTALLESVRASNAIEGIVIPNERLQEIVLQNKAPLAQDEAAIAGYRNANSLIDSDFINLDLRERDILNLHRILYSFSDTEIGGTYKESDNVIIEIDALGNRRIRFTPTPASETPEAIEQLCLVHIPKFR
jgi:Fic family protein